MKKKTYIYFLIIVLFVVLFQPLEVLSKEQPKTFAGQGYVGKLPDLERNYANQDELKKEKVHPEAIPSKDFNSANEIKPIPTDDPTFVNIILKKDKTTQYTNDLMEFLPMLESLYDILDSDGNVQIFNAKVFYFTKNADYFREKYEKRPEHLYTTYKQITRLSTHAGSIALLREEAEKYNPYLAYEGKGALYSPENIKQQLGYLKTEVKDVIVLLKQSE